MRKLIFAILCFSIFFCGQTAYAGGEKTCDNSNFWNAVANECSPHTVDTDTDTHRDDKDAEIGVGVDVVVHEGKEESVLNKVTVEYKYDINNEDHKTYVVATTKLSDVWAKVKNLFNRGE